MAGALGKFFRQRIKTMAERKLKRVREVWYNWFGRDWRRRHRKHYVEDEDNQFFDINGINMNCKVSRMNVAIEQCNVGTRHHEEIPSVNKKCAKISTSDWRLNHRSHMNNPKQ